MTTETIAAPGPLWQRVTLVVLAVYGTLMLIAAPAGEWVAPLGAFLIAIGIAWSAPGNRRYKQLVLGWLATLLALSLLSLLWA
jgi:hypothetical protein